MINIGEAGYIIQGEKVSFIRNAWLSMDVIQGNLVAIDSKASPRVKKGGQITLQRETEEKRTELLQLLCTSVLSQQQVCLQICLVLYLMLTSILLLKCCLLPEGNIFFLMYFTNTGKSRGYETVFSSLAYSFKNKVPHPTYCSKWRCLLFLKLYSKKPASSAVLSLHQDNFQQSFSTLL